MSQLLGEGDSAHAFVDMTLKYTNQEKSLVTENFIVTSGMLEELIFSLEKARKTIKQLESN